jgi:hypothetical protein
MRFLIAEESFIALVEYAAIPISFEVRSVLDVQSNGMAFSVAERKLQAPYVKDYDAIEGEGPRH